MKRVISIGEALIDFIPNQKGCELKNVLGFERVAGGAPANVSAVVAKLGGKSNFISKLGKDAFGNHIIEVLKENEVDEIIIAGMGGMLINNLLKANEKVAHTTEKLILQPMQAPEELRMFLYQNGYKILDEHLVREEHRLYEIIVCKYEGLEPQEIDPIYYEIGLKLIENNDPLLNDFIENKIRINQNVLKKLEGKEGQGIEDKRATLNKKIDALNDLLNK